MFEDFDYAMRIKMRGEGVTMMREGPAIYGKIRVRKGVTTVSDPNREMNWSLGHPLTYR